MREFGHYIFEGFLLGLVLAMCCVAMDAHAGVVPLLRDPNNALVEAQADEHSNQKVVVGGAEDSGNITTTTCALEPDTGCRVVEMPGSGNTWTVAVTGTWVATLQFEGSIDGTNWFSVGLRPADNFEAGTAVTSTTANGVWKGNAGGFSKVRVRASAYTSGTAAVTQRISHATGAVVATGVSVSGSVDVSNVAVGDAIAVRCVSTDGTTFEDCGGTGSGSGGTQYDEDTASAAAEKLMMAGVVRKDTAATQVDTDGDRTTLAVDANGRLWVNPAGVTQTVSGTVTVTDGSGALTVDGTVAVTEPVSVDDNGGSLTVDGTVGLSAGAEVKITDGTDDALVSAGGALLVDGSAVTQPVSGNVGITSFPDNEPINIAQWGGSAPGAGNPVHVAPGGGAIFNVDTDTSDEVTASINQTGTANDVDIASSVTLNVNCTSGCSSTPSTEDEDAFTVGTTAVAVIAGQMDDTSPDTLTEGQVGGVRMTADRAIHVAQQGTVTVTGTVSVNEPVTVDGTVTVTEPVSIDDNGGSLTVDGTVAVSALPEVSISQTAAANDVDANVTALPNEGQQTMANSVSVAIASNQTAIPVTDNAGSLTVDGTVAVSSLPALVAGTANIGDVDVASIAAGDNNIGNVDVVTMPTVNVDTTSADQMTVIPAGNGIACPSYVAISQTADTQLVAGNSGDVFFICAIHIIAGAAEVVSLWEGTGTACGTSSAAIIGSTTEANGVSLAANGGFAMGSGVPFLRTATTGNALCLRQSGTSRVSGFISYRRTAP